MGNDLMEKFEAKLRRAYGAVKGELAAYELKKLKSFRGMEGHGFNVELWRAGKRAAFVIDDGNGGCNNWQWFSKDEEDRWNVIIAKAVEASGEKFEVGDSLLGRMIDDFETLRSWKRQAKTKTLFQVGEQIGGDSYQIVGAPFSPEVKKSIESRHPGKPIRWINEEIAGK